MQKVTFLPENIQSVLDVQQFFRTIFTEYKSEMEDSFHPDRPASEYSNASGPIFVTDDAVNFDACMDKCFEVCQLEGADIYDMTLEEMKTIYGPIKVS